MTRASNICVVGLSHQTATVEVREKLAIAEEAQAELLRTLASSDAITECAVLSTCNRVELYAVGSAANAAINACTKTLEARAPGTRDFLYSHSGVEAVRHLFRVAASLDSMVLGEPQILGQVRETMRAAASHGRLGSVLTRCFDRALVTGKRVRTETEIGTGAVSVSGVACELAENVFGDLAGKRVLLVGAGKMCESAAKHLHSRGAVIDVVNRSSARAEELARAFGGTAHTLDDLTRQLIAADVVICSTASPHFIITPDLMKAVMRGRRFRMLLVVDIAVPRDVDPKVGELENVYVYDIDDLKKVSSQNLAQRRRDLDVAETIVRDEVATFEAWRNSLTLTPTIVELRARFESVIRDEIARSLRRTDIPPKPNGEAAAKNGRALDEHAAEALGAAIVNKLLHAPSAVLRGGATTEETSQMVNAIRRAFDLDNELTTRRRSAAPSAPADSRATEATTDALAPLHQDPAKR